jgi:heavy metal sensor kinase
MKSIRLSLVVYVLVLLAAALGAVSALAFQTAHRTLLAKKEATRKLVEEQYKERQQEQRTDLDKALLGQARRLYDLIKFQNPWKELRYRELHVLGTLTAGLNPNGDLPLVVWAAQVWPTSKDRSEPQSHPGPIARAIIHKLLSDSGKIRLDESSLHPEGEGQVAEYFQLDTAWGSTYRSASLGEQSLPFNPDMFADEQPLREKFDDFPLRPGVTLRRVQFKAPPARFLFVPPRPARGKAASPSTGGEVPPRLAILIQCAADTSPRDAALAALADDHDAELRHLDAETDASLASLRNHLLVIAAVAFAASALGALWLVRLGLDPLQRLSVAVSRVSAKDFRLPFTDKHLPRELTGIVDRLNETLALLKRAFAREKQAAADISHELRTPLAALLTTTEVALRKPRSPEEYREVLADCHESGQQMSRLVERLLTLSRLDAGVDTLRLRQVDAASLAEQCAALVRPLAEARSLSLCVRHDGPALLSTDPDKLREVLTNLLHNAIEYNRQGGSVEVAVARENGHLDLQVRDTGIGIPEGARAHIFERFFRADSARTAEGLHAGLGLSIVKGYVDLMHGSITVESAEGKGSTFHVRLPAS